MIKNLSSAIDAAVEDFRQFVTNVPPQKTTGFTCLGDYICDWLEYYDETISMCSGDYRVFLSAVICIIDRWRDEPDLLDFIGYERVERRVEHVFTAESYSHRILDPYHFEFIRHKPNLFERPDLFEDEPKDQQS